MRTKKNILGFLAGALATVAVYAFLYAFAWIPGWAVLLFAGIVGFALARRLGLMPSLALIAPLSVLALVAPQLLSALDLMHVLMLAIGALGMQILLGLSGQLSLAQGIMVGIGAYTTAILSTDHGWPVLLTLPFAAAVAGVVGWLLGLLAVRFDGVYLAILTGAFAIVMPILLKHFDGLTGGVQGISVTAPESPLGWLEQELWLYYLVAIGAAFAAWVTWNINRGPIGLSLRALHDSPVAACGVGVNLRRGRMQAFLASSALAGFAGGLYAMTVGFVNPDSFGLLYGIHFLVVVVLGGSSSIFGAFLGAGIVHLLQSHLHAFSVPLGSYTATFGPQALYALVLILVLLILPQGATSLPARVSSLRLAMGRRR